MPYALWTLLWLNVRSGLRRMGRSAGTVRGVAFVLLGVGALAAYVLPGVLMRGRLPAADPVLVRVTLPVTILGLVVLNLVTSAGERAVTFSAAEVDFLFPGPFTRRQLLVYKLVKTGLGAVLPAVLFASFRVRIGASYPMRLVGIWLTFQFMQLLAMVAALVQANVGERVFRRGRWWVIGAGVAVAAVALTPAVWAGRGLRAADLAGRLNGSAAGRAALGPFEVFARTIAADRVWPGGLAWAAGAAAIVAGLVGVVVGLDANYLEAAATASAKRYDRVARVRRSGLAGMASPGSARLRVPPLPWLGGVGPIAWRQLTGVLRTARGLLVVTAIVAVVAGGSVARAKGEAASLASLLGLSVWANLFLSSMLRFDFRGDVEHLDVLRSLPLRPTAVAASELVAPTVVLSALQGLLLGAVAIFGHVPGRWLLGAAAFVVPVNALLMGTDNLMFLLFPSRQTAAVAGDMGMVGRQSVVFFCRVVVLLVAAGAAGGVGLGGYLLTGGVVVRGGRQAVTFSGGSVVTAGGGAVVTLVVAVGVTVLLLGRVYDRFDPSVDGPA